MVKAMFGLQHQYDNTPEDHVKAKRDLIETIQRILMSLRLNKKVKYTDGEKINIVLKAGNSIDVNALTELMDNLLRKNIEKKRVSNTDSLLETDNANIRIINMSSPLGTRGLKADYIFNILQESRN
jgi:hypothetical protein